VSEATMPILRGSAVRPKQASMLNIPVKTILGVIIQLSVQHACLSVRFKNLESTNHCIVHAESQEECRVGSGLALNQARTIQAAGTKFISTASSGCACSQSYAIIRNRDPAARFIDKSFQSSIEVSTFVRFQALVVRIGI